MYHLEFEIAAIAKYVAKKALRRADDTEGSHFHSADGTFKPSVLDLLQKLGATASSTFE